MPKRSRKQTKPKASGRDENQSAFDAVQKLLEMTEGSKGKNPIAVALGRRGGLKGGPARAAAMTPAERRKSALNAAKIRWQHKSTR